MATAVIYEAESARNVGELIKSLPEKVAGECAESV